ncbi:MAG: protein-L-isoaspartate(D-aspartate) O-methyltransferase [Ectothiorhodospiraceae bacterium]|nr:protein-L-isoaspartate(D-aspartate) O-methyltransferase [Ectothiorhodospiraceae bacterium]MBN4052968.1 protein-L-isoaspartate(D-aspartate) O-methyltransferase [Gammaproteobacteria bacterium AH-315-K14]MBN4052977.1 protein-L-isoaspartate(D-aspartate) O-methyltransferase [Gammaproteobacteria bacterium AH-315-K14]
MTSQRTRDRLVRRLQDEGISNMQVLELIRNTPRHIFVDEALASRSYEDTALPIGHGQTISQPYVVARMTAALLESGPMNKVLEVGTGSGYQAAILSPLSGQVYSVERIQPLLEQARMRLGELLLRNVRLKHSDGSWGWPELAPFDAIIATAAPEQVPESLLDQLAIGGRLVMPVGPPGVQDLILLTRTEEGIERKVLDKVSFVPMLGGVL